MPELLMEIGTEEIPASFLAPAAQQLSAKLKAGLKELGLPFEEVATLWTCRRLTVHVKGLASRQEDKVEEVQGPPADVAYDCEGKPTKVAQGFARSKGISVEELEVRELPRGRYCFARVRVPGRPTIELLAELLPELTRNLTFPKSMHWQGKSLYFARPIRYIAALFDREVVNFQLAGMRAARTIRGHPFLGKEEVALASADLADYQRVLKDNFVIPGPNERREWIRKQAEKALQPLGSHLADEELLEEVTALVEYPTVIIGSFSEEHLDLPEPVLLEALRKEQRYFPVRDEEGRLLPKFLAVSDRGPSSTQVIRPGYERVLGAKLADARFFWDEDRKIHLEDKVEKLAGIVFHPQLGTYRDKGERLEALASLLAREVGLSEEPAAAARRGARLCKVDLVTLMVQEFPSLEGIIGGEYARSDGESPEVAQAIREHYRPRSPDDEVPASLLGAVLSLADKLDNLAGCFCLGLIPTGSQDPFGLRRDALSIIRTILEKGLELSLASVVRQATRLQPEDLPQRDEVPERLSDFFRDRLYLKVTTEGYAHDLVRGVMKAGFDSLSNFQHRLEALAEVSKTPVWPALVRAVERTYNISRELKGEPEVNEALFETEAEKALWALYNQHRANVNKLIEAGCYQEASLTYAQTFDQPLHKFFEDVFVNVDDLAVRNNRQALLKTINLLFSQRIADLSEIIIPEENAS